MIYVVETEDMKKIIHFEGCSLETFVNSLNSKTHHNKHEKYLHNIKGPAVILFDKTYNVYDYIYWERGKIHRADGPAVIWSTRSGNQGYEFWLEGTKYSLNEWLEKTNISIDEKLELKLSYYS